MSNVDSSASRHAPAVGEPMPAANPFMALPSSKSLELKCAAAPAPTVSRTGPKRTPASSTASIHTSPSTSERFSTRTKPTRPDGSAAAGKNGTNRPASTRTPAVRNAGRWRSMEALERGLRRNPTIASWPKLPTRGSASATRLPSRRRPRRAGRSASGATSAMSLSRRSSVRSDVMPASAEASATLLLFRCSSTSAKAPSGATSAMSLSPKSSTPNAVKPSSGDTSAKWLPSKRSSSKEVMVPITVASSMLLSPRSSVVCGQPAFASVKLANEPRSETPLLRRRRLTSVLEAVSPVTSETALLLRER